MRQIAFFVLIPFFLFAGQKISRQQAVEIAKRANKMEISKDATLEVRETSEAFIIEWKRHLPKGMRGPDYDSQIWVDKKTGKVLRELGGS